MVGIQTSDIATVLQNCVPYFAFFGVVALIAIVCSIVVKKLQAPTKHIIRMNALLASATALVIALNLILTGPMYTIVSLATGKGKITAESTEKAKNLVEKISDESIVLLENKSNLLPFKQGKKLNVFGWASTNPCYGGSGSGTISDSAPVVTLLQGLKNAGFETNSELSDFYTAYRSDRPAVVIGSQDWTLPEPPVSTYSDEIIQNAKDFSDTAMVVITRPGGENFDLPKDMSQVEYTNNSDEYPDFAAGQHYLQLSQSERNLLDMVCSNFAHVIVVYNGSNAFEFGFVKDYPQIQSLLWCSGVGQNGFNSLGHILDGEATPSGRTVDTIVYDLTKTPYYNNIGSFEYDNLDPITWSYFGLTDVTYTPHFVNYVENIYVGYRFYETAAAEGLIDYDKTVQYPFGYGLSYTTFNQKMSNLTEVDGKIEFDVTVTNTGNIAGKDVVQVYYNPPYTNGGIEKATANLVSFDKTEVIQPGESETVHISFNCDEMASYDSKGTGAYVLEAGDYGISIRNDAHTIIDEQTWTLADTITFNGENARSSDKITATNQFDDAVGDIEYLSRADGFANYESVTAAPTNYSLSDHYIELNHQNSVFDPARHNNPDDVMPSQGENNGLTLSDLRGADYDDERWELLLNQMTVDEMNNMYALAGYQTQAVASVGKPATYDYDGPASINNMFTGQSSIGFPCATTIAMTWNTDLAYAFGESIGEMGDEMNVSGWYAPAMNTHRSAFGGRNFEYYSEDGLLSGRMAAGAVQGAKVHGVYAYLKHFALNEQETNRTDSLYTWATEQSIREIYLKPFEIAVKEGGATAIMTAYNFIGDRWTSYHRGLLENVLRGEWGFHGMVISDYFSGSGYQEGDLAARCGMDGCLQTMPNGLNYLDDTQSATAVLALRQTSKNMLYTVANSRAVAPENMNTRLLPWQIALIVVDIALVVALVMIERKILCKWKKETAKTNMQ